MLEGSRFAPLLRPKSFNEGRLYSNTAIFLIYASAPSKYTHKETHWALYVCLPSVFNVEDGFE